MPPPPQCHTPIPMIHQAASPSQPRHHCKTAPSHPPHFDVLPRHPHYVAGWTGQCGEKIGKINEWLAMYRADKHQCRPAAHQVCAHSHGFFVGCVVLCMCVSWPCFFCLNLVMDSQKKRKQQTRKARTKERNTKKERRRRRKNEGTKERKTEAKQEINKARVDKNKMHQETKEDKRQKGR